MAVRRWIAAGVGLAAVGGAIAYAQYRNIEKPAYDSLYSDGEFSVRQYAPIVVAEVTHSGKRSNAREASFKRLAAYIFAEDRPEGGDKIAMTAPVLHEETATDQWRMRFVMPTEYTMETLPKPPSDISLREVPRRRMAVIRFGGNASEADLIVAETRLMDWIESEGLSAVGKPEYAFYDAPMVPGPLRRNEVMIEVAAE